MQARPFYLGPSLASKLPQGSTKFSYNSLLASESFLLCLLLARQAPIKASAATSALWEAACRRTFFVSMSIVFMQIGFSKKEGASASPHVRKLLKCLESRHEYLAA